MATAEYGDWVEQNPLRRWRRSLGLTELETARRLGCTTHAIYLWERGRARPNRKSMARIQRLVGKSTPMLWEAWLAEGGQWTRLRRSRSTSG